MRRFFAQITIGMIALAALLAWSATADAQVYPERIRSVTRKVVETTESARVEVYQRNQQREEQTDRSTRTLRIGANGELYLENIAGDIVITRGGDSEATVEIVKVARDGRPTRRARGCRPSRSRSPSAARARKSTCAIPVMKSAAAIAATPTCRWPST